MFDIVNDIGVQQTIAPAVLTATTTGTAIDVKGFNSAALIINTGAIAGAGAFQPKLQESVDNTTFTDVAAGDLQGSIPTALAANAVLKIGYIGSKRYLRPVLTLASGTSIAAGAVFVLGDASNRPVA